MSPFATSFVSQNSPTHHRDVRAWFQSHLSWVNLCSIVVLLALCIVYTIQVNHAVSKGYQIRDLESQIQELTLRNQKLEVVTQQAQSLENVARATKMLGLVRADRPEYMQTTSPSFALAE